MTRGLAVILAVAAVATTGTGRAATGTGRAAPALHCSYSLRVLSPTAVSAITKCSQAFSSLTLSASRAFTVPSLTGGFGCTATGAHSARCDALGAGRRSLSVTLSDTSVCTPLSVTFNVTAPFPNGSAVTVRGRCSGAPPVKPPPAGGGKRISRAEVARIALRFLHPPRRAGRTAIFTLPGTLAPGMLVSQDDPADAELAGALTAHRHSVTLRLHGISSRRPTVLVWEDLAYGAEFDHPSRALLLDAITGQVVASMTMQGEPLVDGSPPAFVATTADYESRRYLLFANTGPPTAKRRAAVAAGNPELAPVIVPSGFFDRDCLVQIGDQVSPGFPGDFVAWRRFAKSVGLWVYTMPYLSDGGDLATVVNRLALSGGKYGRGCRHFIIELSGHGLRNPKHPGVEVGRIGEAGDQEITKWVYPFDLAHIMILHDGNHGLPRATFDVVIDSCYSGNFLFATTFGKATLTDSENLVSVGTSSDSNQPSWSHISGGYRNAPGKTWGLNPIAWASGYVANDTYNPDDAGEFTRAVIEELYRWATDASLFYMKGQVFSGISRALDAAYKAQSGPGASDFAARIGWTTPQHSAAITRTYHYKVIADSAQGQQTLAGGDNAISGSITSNWSTQWPDVEIAVDRSARIAVVFPASSKLLIGRASGSWSGSIPEPPNPPITYTCSLPADLNAVSLGFTYDMIGGGGTSSSLAAGQLDSYIDTGQVGLRFSTGSGARGVYPDCSSSGNYHPPDLDAAGVLAGADVCVEGSSVDAYGNPFDQVAFDAWKLGGNEIDLMQTFTGNAGLLLGSCFGTRDAETADSASRVSVRYDLSLKLL